MNNHLLAELQGIFKLASDIANAHPVLFWLVLIITVIWTAVAYMDNWDSKFIPLLILLTIILGKCAPGYNHPKSGSGKASTLQTTNTTS